MSANTEIDYGPLTNLKGIWKGDKGLDIAPDPDGTERNPYYETISYSAIGDVTNAESQVLAVVHYRQIVQLKSNDKIFHDQTGYWMWDKKTGIVIHSLTIPRAVSILAGGFHNGTEQSAGHFILQVSAAPNDKDWHIIQSPFMRDNARTTAFKQQLSVDNDTLSYTQTTTVEIYGKVFEHTDQNELTRQ